MLLTYGNEKETLENFVKEMTETLGSIRNAAVIQADAAQFLPLEQNRFQSPASSQPIRVSKFLI